MKKTNVRLLRIGSRGSALALAQVKEVLGCLRKKMSANGGRCAFQSVVFETRGDADKRTSLLTGAPDDFFTDTLDAALLSGEIDVAVHSAKDLPRALRPGLEIFALTAALDTTDALVGRATHSRLPVGARIGTSSPLRREQILILKPDAVIVDVRGTIQERLAQLDKGEFDALIVATCALKRLGLTKRIGEILPWEGTPLQGQLAVVGREGDAELSGMFSSIDVRRHYGRVTLVGAGPGDPDLITLKAVEALRRADCVFYDFLVHKSLLDYAPGAEKIDAGKRKGCASLPQEELSRAIREKAMAGKNVVRLKGGDPLIFGRGADEIAHLREYHIDAELIPGITSATGIPSSLGLPLTARGVSSSVAFMSAHGEKDSQAIGPIRVPDAETLVVLMGLTKLEAIVEAVLAKGWDPATPVIVISRGTWVDEQRVSGDLTTIVQKVRDAKIQPPALTVIGQTVDLCASPLRRGHQYTRILYTGTYPEKYKGLGHLIHFPMIMISPAKIARPAAVLEEIKRCDTILLTSRCGVKYFFEFLATRRRALEQLRSKDFIVIGAESEKQLQKYGFHARLVADPKKESSEGLFKEMKKTLTLKGRRIVFPRSALPNSYLRDALTRAGARVSELIVYTNSKPPRRELPAEPVDAVIFTSPSTVKNFIEDYGAIPEDWKIFAKGEPTRRALRAMGYQAEILVTTSIA